MYKKNFFYGVSKLGLQVFSFKSITSKNYKIFHQKSTENLFLRFFVVDASFEALPLEDCHECKLEEREAHSCKKCGKIVHFLCGKPGKEKMRDWEDEGQTCIEETPVETNSGTCSHLTLDNFLSNKMKENKNDIRAVIGKTSYHQKESGARGRKR